MHDDASQLLILHISHVGVPLEYSSITGSLTSAEV